ncbi:putative metallo-beta-lactamase domain protein [Aspergillus uvarum CBS 121591]|uniref:Putative metallo-beta-lactamase domain protein n=1 Tax=Aspergillus uvarum CBS 121591 TaxID=1448315 RepID=A0A319CI20_9EURO|nr:putative metallo-beta-lactamase domain protein [Aspergillus uvarum CBS 121591]PYH84110.1 putative metallo-beta-lactamase domain protein [Aspergillus uvarum CBS 121591]
MPVSQSSSSSSLDLIICATCGTQFPTTSPPPNCKICDDPRQFIPPTGQSWTTLRALRNPSTSPDQTQHHETHTYHNEFHPLLPTDTPKSDPHSSPNDADLNTASLIAIHTVPKLAIGQRAFLCRTPHHGNILWDCIPFLDDATVTTIEALGGLRAIVISHPHYYATHLEWARAFGCPVYLAREDEEWVLRRGEQQEQVFWSGGRLDLLEAQGQDTLEVIKTGGHFPGSTVLWWRSWRTLLLADTIGTVPSGIYHVDRLPGTASFTFLWSYPNMIPLPPDEVLKIWKAIEHTDFDSTYGAFVGMHTHGDSKKRILESAKIFVRAMGYLDHAIHKEVCL